MKISTLVSAAIAAIAAGTAVYAAPAPPVFERDPTVRAMKDELARAMDKLALPDTAKPYFLSYAMWDRVRVKVTANLGALVDTDLNRYRTLDIDLRVGDPSFDNSNVEERDRDRSITLPVDDDYAAVRRALWLETDREYKHAVETLERKRAVAKGEANDADAAAAFSKEPVTHVDDDRPTPAFDQAALESLARELSAGFRGNPEVFEGKVSISGATSKSYFVSSEGASSVQTATWITIEIECTSQAADGTPLADSLRFAADSIDQLPSKAAMLAQVAQLSRELSLLRAAPIADDYAGPVLFSGVAASQVVRALLAENLAGTPAPKADHPGAHSIGESELAGKVGQRILPVGTSIVDDPTTMHFARTRFDEQGIAIQKVSLVENGTFKRFLMSRTPRKGFEHSNGHGMSSPISPVRAHPRNLIVSSTKGLADAELRRRALAEAKQQDLKYIIIVDKLDLHAGGDDRDFSAFAQGITLPRPAVMKRVYLDGHEELVRGATFGAIELRSLKDLVAIGTSHAVYDYTGSGLPAKLDILTGDNGTGFFVSITAPPLLFRDVDVKKPTGAQRTAPIVSRPK